VTHPLVLAVGPVTVGGGELVLVLGPVNVGGYTLVAVALNLPINQGSCWLACHRMGV